MVGLRGCSSVIHPRPRPCEPARSTLGDPESRPASGNSSRRSSSSPLAKCRGEARRHVNDFASLPLPTAAAHARAADPDGAPELPALTHTLVLVGAAARPTSGALIDRNGFANEYYSAAVRSMSTSWHAFLYGPFDTAGVMTVDKPPLAFWVQALSARVFGFSS